MTDSLQRNYFDSRIETAPREDIRRIQLEKLQRQVAWAFDRVPWYRERFRELGVRPEDIRSLEDVRRLPFSDKQVLRDTYPYGLCAIPLDDVVRLHSSSGTTGKPIVIGYSQRDLDAWSDCVARLVAMAGVTRADRVQMAFGYGMFTGGFGLHYGCEKL
ncbi:MAG: phenylacetate--CoA ligase, partial [Azoarcus sp.]|nr:phenylacetate--CoA ligase [Azoarcus sp.]